MGSSISGILGNHIHGKTRNHRPLLGPNDKLLQEIFLDDVYLQTTNEETADDFHHIINNVHPNLKFEIEKPETTPSGLSLSLLGFQSHPRMATAVLNSTKSQPRNHYLSTINQLFPPKSKLNFIRSERKRIEDRCSSHISVTQHLNTFDDILRVNGYPENSIEKTKRSQNPQRKPRPAETEWSYLKIPYISERLNYRITNIFRKENIPVRIAQKS